MKRFVWVALLAALLLPADLLAPPTTVKPQIGKEDLKLYNPPDDGHSAANKIFNRRTSTGGELSLYKFGAGGPYYFDKFATTESPWFNVLAWGADDTGTLDSSSAINDAIEAAYDAGGGTVLLPPGTFRIDSSVRLRPTVSVVGPLGLRSFEECVLDCRAANYCLYTDGNDSASLTDITIGGFKIDNTNNTNTVDLVSVRRGCSRTQWSLSLYGKTTNTTNGFVLYGHNPDTAAANTSQYTNDFYFNNNSDGEINGKAVYLYGTSTANESCNGNTISGRFEGWVNDIYINGRGNMILGAVFNGPNTGGKVVEFNGENTDSNMMLGNYFDASITGTRVSVLNTDAAIDPMVYCLANRGLVTVTAGSEHVQDDSAAGDYGNFLWQGYRHFVMPRANAVSYSSATHNWVGMVGWPDDDWIVGLAGSNTANSGKIIVSGTGYDPGDNTIGNDGSVSAIINASGSAEFRIVSTADGSSHTKLIVVDDSGNLYPETGLISPCPSTGRTNLDISGGEITITMAHHTVDTQADAPTDDLDTINGGTIGMILTIVAANTNRDVVAKDGTGNLQLSGDCTLDSSHDLLMLVNTGANWKEVACADNGA